LDLANLLCGNGYNYGHPALSATCQYFRLCSICGAVIEKRPLLIDWSSDWLTCTHGSTFPRLPRPLSTLYNPQTSPFSGDHKLSGDPERNCLAVTHLKCAENKIKIKTKEKNGNTLNKSRDLTRY